MTVRLDPRTGQPNRLAAANPPNPAPTMTTRRSGPGSRRRTRPGGTDAERAGPNSEREQHRPVRELGRSTRAHRATASTRAPAGAPARVRVDREQRMRRANEQARAIARRRTPGWRRCSGTLIRPSFLPSGAMQCTPSPALDQNPALFVATEPVGKAGRHGVPHLARRQPRAFLQHLVKADVAFRVLGELHPAFGHEEKALVRREAEPVRPLHIVRDDTQAAVPRVEPIEAGRQLGRLLAALVIRVDAVMGIAEPDRAVRTADDVVRPVQPLALVMSRPAR